MKVKKIISLLVIFIFTCFCPTLTASAAELTKYGNPPIPVIILNTQELHSLQRIGHCVITANNIYVITNIGHPENIDAASLPECKLFHPINAQPITIYESPEACGGKYEEYMNVTLAGKPYVVNSTLIYWTYFSINNSETGRTYLFKVCASIGTSV